MNERIKLLWSQAEEEIKAEYEDESRRNRRLYNEIFLPKFAELIVRECATYMNGRTEDWDAKLRWIFNDGSGYMEVDVESLLNEHFGIEE